MEELFSLFRASNILETMTLISYDTDWPNQFEIKDTPILSWKDKPTFRNMKTSFSIVLDLWGVKKSICMKMCGALNEISEWVYIDPIKLNAAFVFVSAAIVALVYIMKPCRETPMKCIWKT